MPIGEEGAVEHHPYYVEDNCATPPDAPSPLEAQVCRDSQHGDYNEEGYYYPASRRCADRVNRIRVSQGQIGPAQKSRVLKDAYGSRPLG